MIPTIALFAFLTQLAQADRTITIKNECKGTIFPAILGPPAKSTNGGKQPTGWAQPAGQTMSFIAPDPWPAIRLWARTGCDADGKNCKIGKCGDNTLECTSTNKASMGATLVEMNINGGDPYGDFYDVSMIEGFNLPISMKGISRRKNGAPTGSCAVSACGTETDILTKCDPKLVFPPGSDHIWSCATPCLNGFTLSSTFDPFNSVWCCEENRVAMDRSKCTKDKIPYYEPYKAMCKTGYVFADDDANDSVHNCFEADYEIIFCPGGTGSGVNPIPASQAVTQPAGNSAGIDGGAKDYIKVQDPIIGGASGGSGSGGSTGSDGKDSNSGSTNKNGNGGSGNDKPNINTDTPDKKPMTTQQAVTKPVEPAVTAPANTNPPAPPPPTATSPPAPANTGGDQVQNNEIVNTNPNPIPVTSSDPAPNPVDNNKPVQPLPSSNTATQRNGQGWRGGWGQGKPAGSGSGRHWRHDWQ